MRYSCRIIIGLSIRGYAVKGIETCETRSPSVVEIYLFQKFFYSINYAGSSWVSKLSGKFGEGTPHGITFLVDETLNKYENLFDLNLSELRRKTSFRGATLQILCNDRCHPEICRRNNNVFHP